MHSCKGCTEKTGRTIGFHNNCPDYARDKAQSDAALQARADYLKSWTTANRNFRRKTILSTHMK